MPKNVLSRSSAVLAMAAVATLTATGVVSASTTITPANTSVTATSSDLRIITPGYNMRCTAVSGTGNTPATPANTNPSTGGVPIDIGTVSLNGCRLNGVPVNVATSGLWSITVDHDGLTPQGKLSIPAGGAVVTVPNSPPSLPPLCSITVGASTIGPLAYSNPTATASNTGTVNFNSTGGSVCPPAGPGTAALTGVLTFSPGVVVTP